MYSFISSFLILFVVMVSCAHYGYQVQEAPPDLFILASDNELKGLIAKTTDDDPTVVSRRFVLINFDVLKPEQSQVSKSNVEQLDLRTVNFSLDEDTEWVVVLRRLKVRTPNYYSWSGNVLNEPDNPVSIVVKEGVMLANIRRLDALYQVRYVGNNVHAILKIDPSAFPQEAPPIPVLIPQDRKLEPDTKTDCPSIPIDVMVVYTDDAREAEGGTTALEALIDLAVDETNKAYERSEVIQRLNLVHTSEAIYDETGNAEKDLQCIQNTSDNCLDQIHNLRNTHNADIVSLIVEKSDYCGKGYLMSDTSQAFEAWAFNVVERSCATGNFSFAHELGHNMGCEHDRNNTSSSGAYPYSYGYQEPGNTFRTIMALECHPVCCPKAQNFSNPNVSINGIPTGVDHNVDSNNSANNARTLNETRCVVSHWR